MVSVSAHATVLRHHQAKSASAHRTSMIFLTGLVLMCLWPRFFYFSVLGKGINLYYIFSYVMAVDIVRRLALSANLMGRFVTTVRTHWTPFTLFALYHLVRFYCDLQGDTVLHSLAVTLTQTFAESVWLIIPIVYLNSTEKIAQTYRVLVFCGVLFFVFAGIEFYFERPLLTVLRLNNLAVGDKFMLNALDLASSRAGEFRVKGIFVHPIILGQIAGAFAPLGLHALRFGGRYQKIAGALILLGQLTLPSLTGSRTGLVSPIIAMFVYFIAFTLQISNRRRFVALVAIVLFVATTLPIIINAAAAVIVGQDRETQSSSSYREIQLVYGVSAIQRRPAFGFGSDTSITYAGVEGRGNVRTIDNYYLSEAIDHGLIGLVLFVGLILSLFYTAFAMAIREQTDNLRSLFSAMAAIIAAPAVGLAVATISTGLSFIFFIGGSIIALRGIQAHRSLLLRRQRLSAGPAGAAAML